MAIGFVFMILLTYLKFQNFEHNNFQYEDSDSALYTMKQTMEYE